MVVVSSLVAEVKITGADAGAKQLKNVDQSAKGAQSSAKGLLGSMLSFAGGIGIANLVGDAFSFLKDQLGSVFQESMDAQAGMAQTVSVLKSTHDASGQTAQGIVDLASSLSHLTMFSDDTVQAAENMLLTFTNIGKNVFPQATKTVLDMSQALGQDTKTSAIQLGKALNDPIAGISSLTRVGVTFSTAQKDLIKQLVATGDTVGAQKVILAELGKEFGHSAVDAGKTFPGQLKILGQSFDDIKQTIGDALMPVMAQLTSFVSTNVVPAMQNLATWFTTTGLPAIKNFIAFVQANAIPILIGIGAVVLGVVVPAFIAWAAAMIANPVGLIIIGIGLAIAGLVAAFKHFYETNAGFKAFIDGIANAFKQAGAWLQANFLPAMRQVGAFLQSNVLPILQGIGNFLMQTFAPVWQQLVAVWNGQILPALKQLWAALQPLMPVLQAIGAIVGGVIVIAFGFLVGVIKGTVQALGGFLQGVATVIGGIVQFITGIVQVVSGIVTFIYDLLTGNFGKLGGDLRRIWDGIVNMFRGAWGIISGIFQAAWGAISGFVSGLVSGIINFFKGLWSRLVGHSIIPDMINSIISFFGSLPGRVLGFISNLVSGVINKFLNLKDRAVSAVQSLAGRIGDAFSGLGSLVSGIWGGIVGSIRGAINSVIGAINGFLSGLNSIHIDIGSVHIGVSIPLIPYLASGIENFAGGLAYVHKGEVLTYLPPGTNVTPANQVASWANGGGGGQVIQVEVYLDRARLTSNLLPEIVSQVRAATGARRF